MFSFNRNKNNSNNNNSNKDEEIIDSSNISIDEIEDDIEDIDDDDDDYDDENNKSNIGQNVSIKDLDVEETELDVSSSLRPWELDLFEPGTGGLSSQSLQSQLSSQNKSTASSSSSILSGSPIKQTQTPTPQQQSTAMSFLSSFRSSLFGRSSIISQQPTPSPPQLTPIKTKPSQSQKTTTATTTTTAATIVASSSSPMTQNEVDSKLMPSPSIPVTPIKQKEDATTTTTTTTTTTAAAAASTNITRAPTITPVQVIPTTITTPTTSTTTNKKDDDNDTMMEGTDYDDETENNNKDKNNNNNTTGINSEIKEFKESDLKPWLLNVLLTQIAPSNPLVQIIKHYDRFDEINMDGIRRKEYQDGSSFLVSDGTNFMIAILPSSIARSILLEEGSKIYHEMIGFIIEIKTYLIFPNSKYSGFELFIKDAKFITKYKKDNVIINYDNLKNVIHSSSKLIQVIKRMSNENYWTVSQPSDFSNKFFPSSVSNHSKYDIKYSETIISSDQQQQLLKIKEYGWDEPVNQHQILHPNKQYPLNNIYKTNFRHRNKLQEQQDIDNNNNNNNNDNDDDDEVLKSFSNYSQKSLSQSQQKQSQDPFQSSQQDDTPKYQPPSFQQKQKQPSQSSQQSSSSSSSSQSSQQIPSFQKPPSQQSISKDKDEDDNIKSENDNDVSFQDKNYNNFPSTLDDSTLYRHDKLEEEKEEVEESEGIAMRHSDDEKENDNNNSDNEDDKDGNDINNPIDLLDDSLISGNSGVDKRKIKKVLNGDNNNNNINNNINNQDQTDEDETFKNTAWIKKNKSVDKFNNNKDNFYSAADKNNKKSTKSTSSILSTSNTTTTTNTTTTSTSNNNYINNKNNTPKPRPMALKKGAMANDKNYKQYLQKVQDHSAQGIQQGGDVNNKNSKDTAVPNKNNSTRVTKTKTRPTTSSTTTSTTTKTITKPIIKPTNAVVVPSPSKPIAKSVSILKHIKKNLTFEEVVERNKYLRKSNQQKMQMWKDFNKTNSNIVDESKV